MSKIKFCVYHIDIERIRLDIERIRHKEALPAIVESITEILTELESLLAVADTSELTLEVMDHESIRYFLKQKLIIIMRDQQFSPYFNIND